MGAAALIALSLLLLIIGVNKIAENKNIEDLRDKYLTEEE